jgi:hypothetical protein
VSGDDLDLLEVVSAASASEVCRSLDVSSEVHIAGVERSDEECESARGWDRCSRAC